MSKISLAIALLLFLTDRVLKYSALRAPSEGLFVFKNEIAQIGFKYSANPGMAFGIPMPNYLIIAASVVIIGAVIWWMARLKSPRANDVREGLAKARFPFIRFKNSKLLLAILLAGALSNLFDRIAYGHVIDYFYVSFYSTFNLADAMIVVPAIMIGKFQISNFKF